MPTDQTIGRVHGSGKVRRVSYMVFAAAVVTTVMGACGSPGSPRWSKPVAIDPGVAEAYWSVSCPTTRFCGAVASNNVVTWNGSRWSQPVSTITDDENMGAAGISCPTDSFCALVDLNGYAFTFDGRTWSKPVDAEHLPGPASDNHVISCPTSRYCVAIGFVGDVLIYSGGRWTNEVNINAATKRTYQPLYDFVSLSCPTTMFCAASDNDGNVFVYNGHAWSGPTKIDHPSSAPGGLETALSCPTATFCTIVDSNGKFSTFNGVTWSIAVRFDSEAEANSLDSVACPSVTYCVAVDGGGDAFTYNGRTWSLPTHVDYPVGFQPTISCPTDRFCVAANSDTAVTYR